MKIKTDRFYLPITRAEADGDTLTVEGYAFVNSTVRGDRYNLTRAAMEAASEAYMQFPAIREMHGANAAGTAIGYEWDERGVKLTAKIVDPLAILKVQEGVYRGFSVGVRPLILRGNEVVSCDWVETSLVDRPKDPDAVYTVVRTEEFPDEVEADVEVEAAPDSTKSVQRGMFAEYMDRNMNRRIRGLALEALSESLYETLQYGEMGPEDRAAKMDEILREFREYLAPYMERGDLSVFTEEPAPEIVRADFQTRLEALQSERDDAIARASAAESEIVSAKAEIERLQAAPRQAMPAVRYPSALERSYVANEATERDAARAELEALERTLQAEPDEARRREGVVRMQILKQRIAAL